MRELAAIDTSKLGEHRACGPERAWRRSLASVRLVRETPRTAARRSRTLETMPRLAVALALCCAAASAFQAPSQRPRSIITRHAEDPTKVWYADLANGVQNLLQNSPLNEGKKAVVKMMAGGYDVAATNAKLDELIANPVVMLSFTK